MRLDLSQTVDLKIMNINIIANYASTCKCSFCNHQGDMEEEQTAKIIELLHSFRFVK